MAGFYMSGPEEGDVIDQSVLICDDNGEEILLIKSGSLHHRKMLGREIVRLLNVAEAEVMS